MNFDETTDSDGYDLPPAKEKKDSASRFLGQSFLLFLDQLLLAVGGWVYWIIIFRFASTSEVGQATTVYSLVLIFSLLGQLGLEYPLLKKSSSVNGRSKILGTALLLELGITGVSLPIMFYVISNISHQSLQVFSWLAAAMLLASSLGFISRFAILGISNARNVLAVDLIGIVIKFVIGYALVVMGFGAFGMITSILFQFLIMAIGTLVVARKLFGGFAVGSFRYFKEIASDGLVNMPTKIKSILMLSIAVVLLAYFGISSSEIGIFYAAFMLSVITGSLSSSISFTIIPASSSSKTDLSQEGLRIGLSLIAPLIAALIVEPRFILSIIGAHYVSGDTILLVLSLGILPSSVIMNSISKFNHLNELRKVIVIGSIQVLTFIGLFWLLVPIYSTLGAAYSVLISFIAASIPSIFWSERKSVKYISFSCVSIIVGLAAGFLFSLVYPIHPFFTIAITIIVTSLIIIILRNITILEIRRLVKTVINVNER